MESPISTNFALADDFDMVTRFIKALYQPNLLLLGNGLIRGFIFNG